jgi:hypothetical protein
MKKLKRYQDILLNNWNAPYRLNIVNTDTMTEVLSYDITKKSVYILLSSFFVGIFLFFSSLIFFTPLKYYIPGAKQDRVLRRELLKLQHKTDSLFLLNAQKEAYIKSILQVIHGPSRGPKDTSSLSLAEINRAKLANLN